MAEGGWIDLVIADDQELFREVLRRTLEDDRVRVVGESGTGPDTVRIVKERCPHVVLLDLEMPGMSGLEVTEELKRWNPGVRILVLTCHRDEIFVSRSRRLGVAGFLTKDVTPAELRAAVLRVHAGGEFFLPHVVMSPTIEVAKDDADHKALSGREIQVLRLIATGKSSTEIAHILSISIKTVSTYRSRIREKMRLRNTAEIVRYAATHGLFEN
jgi:DNA-binding NarL/FixJ family response regulator